MIDYEIYHFEKIEGPKDGLPLIYQLVGGLAVVGVVAGLGFSVYRTTKHKAASKNLTKSQVDTIAPPINQPEIFKKNDEVFVIKNGQAVPVTETVTLASGLTVNPSGQVTYANGNTVTIANNQAVYPDGSVNYQTSGSIGGGGGTTDPGTSGTTSGGNTGGTNTGGNTTNPSATNIPGVTGGGSTSTTPSDTPVPTIPGPSSTTAPPPTQGPTDIPTPTPTSPIPTPTDIPIPTGRSTVVALLPVDGSGQSGTASIAEINNQVKVQVSVSGSYYPNQPTYIRKGSCPDADNVVQSLANTLYGYGQTVLNITYDQLLAQKPVTVSLHHSAFQINTFTSCGNVP